MPLEIGLVACDVLYTYNIIRANLHYFIYKQHWVAVRNKLAYLVDIHQWSSIDIIFRSLYAVLSNLTAHLTSKLVVNRMTWTGCDNTAFDRLAYQCHIAYKVK